MIMCGAAPLSFELNQKLFELLPNAHIGQAYGTIYKVALSISPHILSTNRYDRDMHSCDTLADSPETGYAGL